MEPAGKSLEPGMYRNDGRRSSSRTSPGFTNCAIGSTVMLWASPWATLQLVVPRSMPMTVDGTLLDLDFGGGDDGGVLTGGKLGQVHIIRAPALVTQDSAGRLAAGRNIAEQFHGARVIRIQLREGAFHAVNHRNQPEVARKRIAALVVEVAHRRADLVVLEGGDVLHQKIQQPGVALEDSQHL